MEEIQAIPNLNSNPFGQLGQQVNLKPKSQGKRGKSRQPANAEDLEEQKRDNFGNVIKP